MGTWWTAGAHVLAPNQCARLSNEVKCKKELSTQCRACGMINIFKYVNNFLSTNPTIFYVYVGGGGGGGGRGGLALKTRNSS